MMLKRKGLKHMLSILLALQMMFMMIGCNESYNKEEKKMHAQAEQAAHDLLEKRLQEQPYNLYLAAAELGDFCFLKMEENLYVINGTYTCTYGPDTEQSFLTVTMEEQFKMQQYEDGTWQCAQHKSLSQTGETDLRVVSSSVDYPEDGLVTSLEAGSYEPFISKEEVQGINASEIAGKLLKDYMTHFTTPEEKRSFTLVCASSSGMPKLEVIMETSNEPGIKNVWKLQEGIKGKYVGYIEGLGYSGPLFQHDWTNEEEVNLNQESFYLFEKADGYSLKIGDI